MRLEGLLCVCVCAPTSPSWVSVAILGKGGKLVQALGLSVLRYLAESLRDGCSSRRQRSLGHIADGMGGIFVPLPRVGARSTGSRRSLSAKPCCKDIYGHPLHHATKHL